MGSIRWQTSSAATRSRSGRTTGNSSITRARARSTGTRSVAPSDPSAGPQPTSNGRPPSTAARRSHPKLISMVSRSPLMSSSRFWLPLASSQPPVTKEDFLEGMKVFDKEGNGYVLAVEIQHVLASLGESLKQEEVDEIFKGVEVNSNGAM